MVIFKLYVSNSHRDFDANNTTFLVAGTLLILISSFFIAAGIPMGINPDIDPNEIVMNTVIASGASGLLVALSQ